MKNRRFHIQAILLIFSLLFLFGCQEAGIQNGAAVSEASAESTDKKENLSGYLSITDQTPSTVDPQCTSGSYNVPLNIFDRLVEIETDPENQSSQIVPSLADSWEISPDGLVYTFHLHPGVTYSNGNALTSSDVEYTLIRLLTWPESVNQDLAIGILGAAALRNGETDTLEGFSLIDDVTFSITLEQPYAAFLACLSTPGASILDEESTNAAGPLFGKTPESTIGSGPFIFREWIPNDELILKANPDCWSGAPLCDGIRIHLIDETEVSRRLFENGEIDILDLENLGGEAEYYVHGKAYKDVLVQGPRVGITYVALNHSVTALKNVLVRKALQMALDRRILLQVAYGGRGAVENGIFPRGLIGYDPELPEIPYDLVKAKALLEEAGYSNGFSLDLSLEKGSSATLREEVRIIAYMWEQIGIKVHIYELDPAVFMAMRKNGSLACYVSTWSADFNDPDNFIYTFFGSEENTTNRSICYANEEVMQRIYDARGIVDEETRIREYQALQKQIVQEEASWIPLYSRQHLFVLSPRVEGFRVSWNGWSSNKYRNVSLSTAA